MGSWTLQRAHEPAHPSWDVAQGHRQHPTGLEGSLGSSGLGLQASEWKIIHKGENGPLPQHILLCLQRDQALAVPSELF